MAGATDDNEVEEESLNIRQPLSSQSLRNERIWGRREDEEERLCSRVPIARVVAIVGFCESISSICTVLSVS